MVVLCSSCSQKNQVSEEKNQLSQAAIELAKIRENFSNTRKMIVDKLKNNKDNEEQHRKEYSDFVNESIEVYKGFVEKYDATDEGLSAKFQLLILEQSYHDINQLNKIITKHINSKKLGKIIDLTLFCSKDQKRKLFTKLIKEAKHDEVKVAGHYGFVHRNNKFKKEEREKHFKIIMEKYKDVLFRGNETYGVRANIEFNGYSYEDLSKGKKAPEIVGRDHTGKEMKLSDYLGKVVVLDFWGHW